LGCKLIVWAKITQRAGTLTERPPVVDPDGTAMGRLGPETACQGEAIKNRELPPILKQTLETQVAAFQPIHCRMAE